MTVSYDVDEEESKSSCSVERSRRESCTGECETRSETNDQAGY